MLKQFVRKVVLNMWSANGWKDYEILDAGNGQKLERWGEYYLVRPDPQAIWPSGNNPLWHRPNGKYIRSKSGGGHWEFNNLPQVWQVKYRQLTFQLKPFNFKHTGLFPEQAANWDWIDEKIKSSNSPIKVLNLFAYTGGATVAAAAAGASVTHVDAAKGMVGWAKDNSKACGLKNAPIRYIVDDCVKFVAREIKRGNKYDAVIMDPPSYGRGPGGEIWKIEEQLYPLAELCVNVLNDHPLFFLINSYTTGLAPSVLTYILGKTVGKKYGGYTVSDEIGLPVTESGLYLPCGASGRWERK